MSYLITSQGKYEHSDQFSLLHMLISLSYLSSKIRIQWPSILTFQLVFVVASDDPAWCKSHLPEAMPKENFAFTTDFYESYTPPPNITSELNSFRYINRKWLDEIIGSWHPKTVTYFFVYRVYAEFWPKCLVQLQSFHLWLRNFWLLGCIFGWWIRCDSQKSWRNVRYE